MLSAETLLAFLAVSLLHHLRARARQSHGPVAGACRAGAWPASGIAVGCALGCVTHILWATLGVSAVIASSPTLFLALKLAGSAYLAWLGIQALRSFRRPPAGRRRNTSGRTLAALPAPRLHRQRHQPQGGAVLPRLHAAVPRPSSATRACRWCSSGWCSSSRRLRCSASSPSPPAARPPARPPAPPRAVAGPDHGRRFIALAARLAFVR